ncbi:MAG: amidinotransferase [Chloroflexi bacterium]|nr:MAG: amidinotransferase [Chloroflexota bacterium]
MSLLPPFIRALVRRPSYTMAEGITTQSLGIPDFDKAIEQYGIYLDTLRACGLYVTALPPDERYPDGHFIEDDAVIFGDMAFICNLKEPTRAGEIVEINRNLAHLQRFYVQSEDAYIDGGDVLFTRDRVLVGVGNRTNSAGVSYLRAALQKYNEAIHVDEVPFSGVLHLKTGLTELAPGVLVRSPNIDIDYDLSFSEVYTLPEEEAYAANCLPINDYLLIAKGNYPVLKRLAEKFYLPDRIFELEMSEFEKMDGGLTCLSLRY